MYLPIDKSQIPESDLGSIDYVRSENDIFIIGEDAFRFANIFGNPVRRPMSRGLISSDEIDGIDVLTLVLKQLVGEATKGYCVYSVPSPSVDLDNDIIYHQNVFGRIFRELGYDAKPCNESMGIIYSECQNDNFTALAFSYGDGMSNVTLSYKGAPVLSFSVARGGGWIDQCAARSLGTVPNRITSIKENNTDLSNYRVGNKRERRTREAIVYYYRELIEYTFERISQMLERELGNLDLPEAVPIVVSGGTSKATGFLEFFKDIGFKVDGVLRADCFKKGRYWDSYYISMLRSDYERIYHSEQQEIPT